jgi:hypothetical protein
MGNYEMLSYEEKELINGELNSGEKVLWADKPSLRSEFLKSFYIYLFAIPWIAIFIFFRGSFYERGRLSAMFLIPFILAGIYMLFIPFIKRIELKKTVYLVTNQRLIIYIYGWKTKVKSFQPSQIRNVERHQKADGFGNLIFAKEVFYDSDGDRRTSKIGFMGIKDVKQVEDLIYKELLSTIEVNL